MRFRVLNKMNSLLNRQNCLGFIRCMICLMLSNAKNTQGRGLRGSSITSPLKKHTGWRRPTKLLIESNSERTNRSKDMLLLNKRTELHPKKRIVPTFMSISRHKAMTSISLLDNVSHQTKWLDDVATCLIYVELRYYNLIYFP